MIDMPAS